VIREITIKNVALIDTLTINFSEGLSVLTGETGAGKSILIGAINLLLGDRASTEVIRSGADEAEVSGVFELSSLAPALLALCEEAGIDHSDNTFIIRRTVNRNGRNRIYINQTPVPLATLKQIGDHLVDLHGQHDHQSLLNPQSAFTIIDALPGVVKSREAYGRAWALYSAACVALEQFDARAAALEAKRELIEFQHQEIAALNLEPGEDVALQSEFALLASVTERLQLVAAINAAIEGTPETPGLAQTVSLVRKKLDTLHKLDPAAAPWISQIDSLNTVVRELTGFCTRYSGECETSADPARLDDINNRLAKIQRLIKKNHCTFAELLEKKRLLAEELGTLENSAADRSVLAAVREKAIKECRAHGATLRAARTRAARTFDTAVSGQMAGLGFVDGRWRTTIQLLEEPTPLGLENITFDVQTNPGEPFLPLARTASGGEISRLMLAVKSIIATNDRIPVLIFDEIDTGIGGRIAVAVGDALAALSASHQVICISHLHQIASLAKNHFRVWKTTEAGRTVTRIACLTEKEKIEEIARMLGSDSELGRKHAAELVQRQGRK
jgi:DNA repair protein RecN (Recombination protein N)